MNKIKKIILFTGVFSSLPVDASYYGRFISGGFFSKEVFRNSTTDRYNDVAILSQRMFLSVDKIGESTSEFTFDARDKHNFFDKLDKERLTLTSKNEIQLHQLNIHSTGDSEGAKYSLGRFPISEAGSVYVDGIDFGVRKNIAGYSNKFSLFYGLNPQSVDEVEMNVNSKAKVYGVYDVLEDKNKDWGKYFYFANALVRQIYSGTVDRFYFYNNTVMQSENEKNFMSLLYLDLEPKITIQNLWTSYYFKLTNNFNLNTSLSTIDSLHYKRVQDVRETLPSSRFNQASISLRSPSEYGMVSYEGKLSYGLREVDKKDRVELRFNNFYPKFIFDDVNGNLSYGVRKNFTSNDGFVGMSLVHSNKFREISFSQDIEYEKHKDAKQNFVFITDGSYTKFYSRSLFGILSLQNTWDNEVSIFSILFKISYRFGEGGQAPIRDGSPPQGRL